MDRTQYLQMQGQSEEEFDAELQQNVQQAVKTQLVLDALADREEVSVSDQDLTEHIVAEAARYGVAPQTLAQQVQQSGNIPALIADVRRNKAMRLALGAATVTDTAGAAVDLTPLLGPIADDTEADAEADASVPAETEPEQQPAS
jgi:trigger factor